MGGSTGRWLLLLALAAGLVGMHHLEASGGPPTGQAMTGPVVASPSDHAAALNVHDADMPGMAMAMHMCLAVLGTALLLGLLLLVATVFARRPAPPAPRAVVLTAARPPPRSAVRLALLCVLRN